MPVSLTTEPTIEPVSVQEFRDVIGYSDNDQDAYFTHLLTAARVWCENYCWSQFINGTYTATQSRFTVPLVLSRPPLVSVTSVKYYDTTNTQQTLSTSLYRVQAGASALIEDISGFPATYDRADAVEIIYVAGYGTAQHDVPEPIRIAISYLAKAWYACDGCTDGIPPAVQSMLSSYRFTNERALEAVA